MLLGWFGFLCFVVHLFFHSFLFLLLFSIFFLYVLNERWNSNIWLEDTVVHQLNVLLVGLPQFADDRKIRSKWKLGWFMVSQPTLFFFPMTLNFFVKRKKKRKKKKQQGIKTDNIRDTCLLQPFSSSNHQNNV